MLKIKISKLNNIDITDVTFQEYNKSNNCDKILMEYLSKFYKNIYQNINITIISFDNIFVVYFNLNSRIMQKRYFTNLLYLDEKYFYMFDDINEKNIYLRKLKLKKIC